jgi:hypothetical protein
METHLSITKTQLNNLSFEIKEKVNKYSLGINEPV